MWQTAACTSKKSHRATETPHFTHPARCEKNLSTQTFYLSFHGTATAIKTRASLTSHTSTICWYFGELYYCKRHKCNSLLFYSDGFIFLGLRKVRPGWCPILSKKGQRAGAGFCFSPAPWHLIQVINQSCSSVKTSISGIRQRQKTGIHASPFQMQKHRLR